MKSICGMLVVAIIAITVGQTIPGSPIDLDDLINGIVNGSSQPSTPVITTSVNTGTAPANNAFIRNERPICPENTSLCVPYNLCGSGKLTGNELNLDDPTNACHYLQKCCAFQDIHEDRITTTTIRPSITNSTGTTVTIPPRCGIRNKEGTSYRITNARENEAEFGEFPWMVAVLKETELLGHKMNVYTCGGSLIHARVVLTAAHCVQRRPTLTVRAGEWDTQTDAETVPHQDRAVSRIVVHERYYTGGLFNDIALLIVDRPFEMTDTVAPVCLASATANFDSITCTASGWGANEMGGREQNILKKINLPIVPRTSCERQFQEWRNSSTYALHPSYLCAGGKVGEDTCKGDGGSPLVCPTTVTAEQYVQAGVVSWGRGCGNMNTPAIYANIAALRDWIDSKMVDMGFSTAYYTV